MCVTHEEYEEYDEEYEEYAAQCRVCRLCTHDGPQRTWYAWAEGYSARSWPFQANSNSRWLTPYDITSSARFIVLGDDRSTARLSAIVPFFLAFFLGALSGTCSDIAMQLPCSLSVQLPSTTAVHFQPAC